MFIDTPGIHKPLHRMNQRMVDAAIDTLREVDVAVLVVDATRSPAAGTRSCWTSSARPGVPTVLALNKIDLIEKPPLLPLMEHYAAALPFKAIVPMSALTGDGQAELLKREILAALPEGEAALSRGLPDRPERAHSWPPSSCARRCCTTRATNCLTAPPSSSIDSRNRRAEGGLTRIFASILVDTTSQKPIVVGKGGEMIKRIGTEARQDLEEMLDGRVYLDLHVKVREDWRDDERLLRRDGTRTQA